jgi:hypothetical protein
MAERISFLELGSNGPTNIRIRCDLLEHQKVTILRASYLARILVAFAIVGSASGLVFSFITSPSSLQSVWYSKADKFFVPKISYWLTFGAVLGFALVIVHSTLGLPDHY